jgi:8-oxo-dGTP pyrophosphatase MutT (NUDIX family)
VVLLVTARREPHDWIFPKGHVEKGESAEQTAVREAEEEAGVQCTIVAPAGSTRFERDGRAFDVQYFLARTSDLGASREGRELAWCDFAEARRRIPFDDMRKLLIDAWPIVLRER